MTGGTLRPVTDDDLPAPRVDQHSAIIVSDAVDALRRPPHAVLARR
jgi:hypothetical protein